jgi:hypothetical protein
LKPRIWITVFIGYLVLRWAMLLNPGYVYDLLAYKRWAVQAARFGIAQVYRTSDMDYPPLYAYLLAPLGHLYGWFMPASLQGARDSLLLTVLIKLPPLLFDLAIAYLLFRFGRRYEADRASRGKATAPGAPTPGTSSRPWGLILAAAYLFNPVVLFNHAYWGEPDSIHSFLVLAAFLALGRARPPATLVDRQAGKTIPPGRIWARLGKALGPAWPAWTLLTLAMWMKPLAAPFFPLLLVLSWALCGVTATLIGMGAAGLTTLLVFLPFLISGQGGQVLQRVVGDVGLMAYTSSNAHNLWWALGSWRSSETPWLGPLTSTQIGLALFGIAYLGLLYKAHRLHRSQKGGLQPFQVLGLALGVGFSFFMLSTHMHENHMFIVVPLAAPLLLRGRAWRYFFLAASLGILLNLVLHDLVIPEHWPFTIGGATGIMNKHLNRPFCAVEIGAIWFSTVYNLALFAAFLYGIFRPGGRGMLSRSRESAGAG